MLRHESPKTRRKRKPRQEFVARLFVAFPRCQVDALGCTGRSTQVHEKLTRASGGSILDESNCVAVCANCHPWIHSHPALATSRGLLVSQYDSPPVKRVPRPTGC